MDTVWTDSDATRPSQNAGNSSNATSSSTTHGSLLNQFSAGDMIDNRYQIISVLGRGGFGCVYKVVQTLIKKEYALKTLNPVNTTDITIQRLRKEGQAAGRLDHPNLVRAVDFGMIEGVQPFLVMDLVEGPTLSQFLKQCGRASLSTTLQIFMPLCDALAYAHNQGVVHRDLKPSNVILSPDESGILQYIPKIVDFGIAKIQFSDESHGLTLTGTGDIFGTPLYMSPEQCMGSGVDSRSDIYALGCMLFETLTGAPPFSGTNPLEIMMQHGSAKVPSLKEASLGEIFPPALERIVLRMLAKDPADRYQNCASVARDLASFQRGDFKQIDDGPTAVMSRQRQKNKISAIVLAAVMGTVGGAAAGYAAHQFMTAPATVKPAPAPTADVQFSSSIVDFQLDADFNYFSKVIGNTKTFDFPARRKHSLGDIYWWQDNRVHKISAVQKQSVPKDAGLIFSIAGEMLMAPDLWPRFHTSEFEGIVIDLHSCYVEDEPLNQSLHEITQQQNLKVLVLNEKNLFKRTLNDIGNMTKLRWFDASHLIVDETPLTGDELIEMENFDNLKVLRLFQVEKIAPVLTELAKKTSIKRLGLARCGLTPELVKTVSRIQSLEVLSLRDHDVLSGADVFASLAKLPKLKRLVLDQQLLASATPSDLSRLHDLTIITVASALPQPVIRAIENNKSIKLILNKDLYKNDGDWFDPLKEDPDTVLGPR